MELQNYPNKGLDYMQRIAEDVKVIITDLDEYMTAYEKGEYLRSFLGEVTPLQYWKLRKPWRKLWDGFYPAAEFTRHFVQTYTELLQMEGFTDPFHILIYAHLKGKIAALKTEKWNRDFETFRAKQREAKHFHTGGG